MKKSFKLILLFAIISLAFGLGFLPGPATVHAGESPDLFTPVIYESSPPIPEHPDLIRSRLVNLNFQYLESDTSQVTLNLFEDASYPALLEKSEIGTQSVWSGTIPGSPYSEVLISDYNGAITGFVRLSEALYLFQQVPGNGTAILQVTPDNIPALDSDSPAYHPSPPLPPASFESDLVLEDSSDQIDIMIVYTANARSDAGGTNNMLSKINGIITETNNGFNNSNVNTQVRLVHTMEVAYDDSWIDHRDDWSPMLSKLTSKTDGVIDNVHSARDQYGADLVVLLISDDHLGGIAWLMASNNSYYERYGFSVVAQAYALGWYITGHEMGHNMGCHHDRANVSSGSGAYSYSYGYQMYDVIDNENVYRYRTIMAYNCPGGCSRVNHWSNPNVSYNGYVTGIPDPNSDSADNARSLNNTIFTVANFRQSVNQPPGTPTITSPTGLQYSQTLTFIWQVEDGADEYHIIAEHASDGNMDTWVNAADVCGVSTCEYTPGKDFPIGDYSWKLLARNADGDSAWSAPLTYTVMLPPGLVTQSSPSSQIDTITPTFIWDAVEQGQDYRLYITNSGGVVLNQWLDAGEVCSGSTCSHIPPIMLEPGPHNWMILARNSAGSGPWTEALAFTVAPEPGQVTVTGPSGEITAIRPTYTFSSDSLAQEYRLLVSHAAFGTVVNEWHSADSICSGDTCSILADTHLSTGNHSFWIQTRNVYHPGPYSSASNFKLIHQSPPVDAIVPIAPINEVEIAVNQPTLTWQEVELASWYKVFMSDNISGKIYNAYHRASEVCYGTTCSLDLSTVGLTLVDGRNNWWVMPVNTGGNGAWSAKQTFDVLTE